MTYKYYHEVIKGNAPKNAPTYQEIEKNISDKTIYICEICGYVHEGELPDDFICPICGAEKKYFRKNKWNSLQKFTIWIAVFKCK